MLIKVAEKEQWFYTNITRWKMAYAAHVLRWNSRINVNSGGQNKLCWCMRSAKKELDWLT